MNEKLKCLRCEKNDTYQKKNFKSAWCTKCHKEKFGCTHEERNVQKLKLKFIKII